MDEGFTPNMHRADVVDPLEKRLDKSGGDVEETFDGLMQELERNPDNKDAQRQAQLLVNRLEDFLKKSEDEQTKH
jgi:hypothetical protein